MRKIGIFTLLITIMLNVFITVNAKDNYTVYLDDVEVVFDISPVCIQQEIMVPLRGCFEMLETYVEWNNDEQSITAGKDSTTVFLQIDSNTMLVNDNVEYIDVAPIIINDRVLVPLKPIALAFNYSVDIDYDECKVKVFSDSHEVSDIALFNKNEEIDLTQPLLENSNGHYISLNDINKINLSFSYSEKFEEYVLGLLYGNEKVYLDTEEKTLYGMKDTYQNACEEYNGDIYISVYAIAEEFSLWTSYEDDGICLWINDYTTDTYRGEIVLPDDSIVPQTGLPVTVYIARMPNGGYSSGGGSNDNLGYMGTDLSVPKPTDTYGMIDGISIISEKTFVIPFGQDSVDYLLDAVVRAPLSGGHYDGAYSGWYFRYCIGYKIDTQEYRGGGYRNVNTFENTINVSNYFEKVFVNGSITVPNHDNDLHYTVVAEGNRAIEYNKNGSYQIHRECCFVCNGIIPAGENNSDYSILVKPNKNYHVYVVFSDGEYVRKETDIVVDSEDATLNFDDFVQSKKYSGIIRLPDDVDEFTDFKGDSLENVRGRIVLQSSTTPYYYLDEYRFNIDTETKECEFSLTNDIGVEGVIIYFEIFDRIKDVYCQGNYKNDSEIAPNVSDVTEITFPRDDIIISVSKGRTLFPTVEYANENISYAECLVYAQSNLSYSNKDLPIYGERYNTSQENNNTIIQYSCTVPENYVGYIVSLNSYRYTYDYQSTILYGNDSGFYDEIGAAKVYSVTDNPHITFIGYEPKIPITFISEPHILYAGTDNLYSLECKLWNGGDFEYNDIKGYIAFYDESGKLLLINSFEEQVEAHGNLPIQVDLDRELVDSAHSIKLLLWDSNMQPLSEKASFIYSDETLFLNLCNSADSCMGIYQALNSDLYRYMYYEAIKYMKDEKKLSIAEKMYGVQYQSTKEFDNRLREVFKELFPTSPGSGHHVD